MGHPLTHPLKQQDPASKSPGIGKPCRKPARPKGDRRARLEAALDTAATLVLRFGNAYLPFFLKLEAELKALESEQDALARVRRRVGG